MALTARRPLEDEIFVRFPFLYDLALRGIDLLRPGSRLRGRLVARAVQRNYDASGRRDLEYMVLGLEPDCQVSLFGAGGLGLAESYAGHEGFRAFAAEFFAIWSEARWTLTRIRDAGDRMVLEATNVARGGTSGVPVSLTYGTVLHRSPNGKVSRLEYYWQDGWPSALRAAGLNE